MDKLIVTLTILMLVGVLVLTFPEGVAAVLVLIIVSAIVLIFLRRLDDDVTFITRVFLVALIARVVFGTVIHVFELREFFGGDALTYDGFGNRLVELWYGRVEADDPLSLRAMSTGTPGWGMNYLTAFIYFVLGRNILAAQFFCAVIGAATAPAVYACALSIFNNRRVGKIAGFLVALSPAFIIWSGQLLKDGLIIFLLVVIMTMVLKLQEKFDYFAVAVLIGAIFGILSLRFYIFYMVAVSVAGSFILGQSGSRKALARGFVLLVLTGVSLTYLGVVRTATENFDKWGSLESVQRSRSDLARSADSGFGEDIDVSTTQGALFAIPTGMTYLLLAPFPWQLANLRQAITLPETLLWWSCIPFMLFGISFTLRNRLRKAMPIIIFTVLLTLAYSIFQGNVGTSYRQRTQIQVFLFMFVAVGITVKLEKRENRKAAELARRERVDRQLRDRRRIELSQ